LKGKKMSLDEIKIVDRVEVLENGCVQVRTATRIIADGTTIKQSFHRHVVAPGDDYSGENDRVQAICAATHTPEVIDAYKAAIAAKGI
jgi:hypothetical protein